MNHHTPRTMQNHDEEARRKTVGKWLSLHCEWRIPVYQRHYAWESKQNESGPINLFWETVKGQTKARLRGEEPKQHYLGAVLVKNMTSLNTDDAILRYDVVDGQQRLTTIQIALLAILPIAAECGYGDEIKEELRKYIFYGEDQPRLSPTNFDREQFKGIVYDAYEILLKGVGSSHSSRENDERSKISSAYESFKEKHKLLVNEYPHQKKEAVREIMNTLLEGFDIVRIVLRDDDDAQRVFESLNNYAMPLTTFDLIRNNVFERAAKIKPGLDVVLFNQSDWKQLEKPYWEKKSDQSKNNPTPHIEAYIARMLVAKMKDEIRFGRSEIFRTYKEFVSQFRDESLGTDDKIKAITDEIESLVDYVDIYCYLDSGTTENSPDGIDFGVFRHQNWQRRDFYPVIFTIMRSDLDVAHKQKMIRLLESYVVRRSFCGLTQMRYNLYAPMICKVLDGNLNYERLRDILDKSKQDTYVFPDDDRVKRDCELVNFYRSSFPRYVFDRIEVSMHTPRAERVVVDGDKLTMDHILPRQWHTNTEWKKALAKDDAADPEVNLYINTIGNLAMMSGVNNAIKSNRSFEVAKRLLANSGMIMNRKLADEDEWNIQKIRERSQELATQICKIWPCNI